MFKKIKYRIDFIKSLYKCDMRIIRYNLIIFTLSVFALILTFINPIFYKIFIDDVIIKANISKLKTVIVGYFSIFLLNMGTEYGRLYFTNKWTNKMTLQVKKSILNRYFKYTYEELFKESIGDLKMLLEDDTVTIKSFARIQSVDYVISLFTVMISTILLLCISWKLTLSIIFVIPITLIIDAYLSKHETILNDQNRENDQKIYSWLHASFQGWKEIKALNLIKRQEKEYTKYLHNYALYFAKWINYWVFRVLIVPKMKDEFTVKFLLYFFGGFLIINDNFQIGSLLLFANYFELLMNSVKSVSLADSELQAAMPYTNRLLVALKNKGEIKKQQCKVKLEKIDLIEFKNVGFQYMNSEKSIFKNFNCQINKGERVAIVGESGKGKSTLLKLLVNMYEPCEGSIYYSGIDLKILDKKDLYKKIGFIMQENLLFNASIRDNLMYGCDNATVQEIEKACSKACILDFIKSLQDGFETIIGEKGIKLSGGQRQRIILARVFLRDVDVYIFDEATSALDQHNEMIVHKAINQISRDKIIIIVAHRESSISLCDRKIEI